MTETKFPHRILIVDDEQSILDAYRQVLSGNKEQAATHSRLVDLENKLFPNPNKKSVLPSFDLCLCRQGQEAVEAVHKAVAEELPFSVAFIDVRMPPGKDGIWAASQIRQIDPWINIVIVTAYSDLNPAEINQKVQPANRLLYMQKPFHSHEIQQLLWPSPLNGKQNMT